MKLSEAILNGCSYKPQIFGNLANDYGVCALGAALCGKGMFPSKRPSGNWNWNLQDGVKIWKELWPYVVNFPDKCFVCNMPRLNETPEVWIISHLNDDHKWSREAIAMWVESIEKKLENAEKKQEEKTEIVNSPVVNGECVVSR